MRDLFRLAHAVTRMGRAGLLCLPEDITFECRIGIAFQRQAVGCLSSSSARDAFSLGILLCRAAEVTVPRHCLSGFRFSQFYSRALIAVKDSFPQTCIMGDLMAMPRIERVGLSRKDASCSVSFCGKFQITIFVAISCRQTDTCSRHIATGRRKEPGTEVRTTG
jgi:hypothetical protein